MVEIEVDAADASLAPLVAQVERGVVVILTRNRREVARVVRADEPAPASHITGEEAVRRFEALQARVRDHWPDEPEFDWKEAIQHGRR